MTEDQPESDHSGDTSEGFQPKTPAMKRWKQRYIDHEESDDSLTEEDERDDSDAVVHQISDGNLQFRTFCQILIAMVVIGAIFSFIGYVSGSQTCDDDGLFEILGGLLFWIGMLGIPINLLILRTNASLVLAFRSPGLLRGATNRQCFRRPEAFCD